MGDAGGLAAVQLDSALVGYAGIFPPHAPEPTLEQLTERWWREIAQPANTAYAAVDHDAIVGSVSIGPDPEDERVAQLRKLYVAPERWGTGIGVRLHDVVLDRARQRGFASMTLWVLEENVRARRMYERWGWRLVPDRTLDWPGLGVIEVRYVLDTLARR
jgi:GNAT superfamily N-acetyltransferase